jgi:glutamate 5-kinase
LKQLPRNYKRIVIKIGSSLLYSTQNNLDFAFLSEIARQISHLVEEGGEVIIVSSGAIALGMHALGLEERPKRLEELQAVAAIGQNELMNVYRNLFGKGYFTAQILLTWEDLDDRKRCLKAKNTLNTLLENRKYRIQHIVPIINENDTVATDEIKFGDNDQLSARVASLFSADLLIILSDVDGLLDDKKNIINIVPRIDSRLKELACPTNKKACVGGMITKIEAAKIAVDSGILCVIANGRKKGILSLVIKEPEKHGTLFLSKKGLAAKKRWIAFGAKPKGRIIVDEGARKALINKKSLLSVGITACESDFSAGDIVSLVDKGDREFARGQVKLSSKELDKVKGKRYDKEIVHRDNIVIL